MHQFYVNNNHIKFITDDNQNVLSVNINHNLCASFYQFSEFVSLQRYQENSFANEKLHVNFNCK